MNSGKKKMPALQRALVLACLAIVLLYLFLANTNKHTETSVFQKTHRTRYGVMLDAGSTGSRVHVYQFSYSAEGPQVLQEVFEQVKPGLSSYAGKPEEAAKSLIPLIQVAFDSIPREEYACTPLALKATAGLRLLPGSQATEILSSVEKYLGTTGFFLPPNSVTIMDGSEEGIYAWITVNFLLGRLGLPQKLKTVGIMDLGGGSTQIVVEPKDARSLSAAPDANTYSLNFGKHTYKLYQHSYLGYGLMEARKKIKSQAAEENSTKKTACLPAGFTEDFVVGGNTFKVQGHSSPKTTCLEEANQILNKKASCGYDSCSFAGVFQPPATSFPSEMYAFSYFYDRTETMKEPFPSSLTIEHYKTELQKYCGKSLKDATLKSDFENNSHVCMDLSFIHELLKSGYGLPGSTTLQLAKKIKGYETGWCMGAMMKVLDDQDALCKA